MCNYIETELITKKRKKMKVTFNSNGANCVDTFCLVLNQMIGEASSELLKEEDPKKKRMLTAGINRFNDIIGRIKAGENIEFDFTSFDENNGLDMALQALGGLIGVSCLLQVEQEDKKQ